MNTIANASNEVRVSTYGNHNTEMFYGITCRPCEHKIVTLNNKRKQYHMYTLNEQKEILMNIIDHCSKKGLFFSEIFYEHTKIKVKGEEKDSLHFHCILSFREDATYIALKEHSILLNSRYGVPSYTAFDFKILCNEDDLAKWKVYIRKDIKHPINVWCCGI